MGNSVSQVLKTLKKSILFLVVGASLYVAGIISLNFYLENKLERKAERLKVGLMEAEVIKIMGKPRYIELTQSSALEAGDWSNRFSGLVDCLSYRDIQQIENLYYFGYFNFLFKVGSFKKTTGDVFVIIYFNKENKQVVCVRKIRLLS